MSGADEFPSHSQFWDEVEPIFRRVMKSQGVSQEAIDWVCRDLAERVEDPELCKDVPSDMPESCVDEMSAVLDCLQYVHGALTNLHLNLNDLELLLHRAERLRQRRLA